MNLDQLNSLSDYFDMADVGASLQDMLVNTLVLIVLNMLLALIYIKTANTHSNRKRLAAIFPLLSMTTMMIISVIKSSLALSLGMVGALSIVRFRSAIKEPEELTYIFLAISLGLGMGAGQQEITLAFFIIVGLYLVGKNLLSGKIQLFNLKTDQSLYLTFATSSSDIKMHQVISILEKHCHFVDLKRSDSADGSQEYLFVVKINNHQQLINLRQELLALDQQAQLSILNDEKLFA